VWTVDVWKVVLGLPLELLLDEAEVVVTETITKVDLAISVLLLEGRDFVVVASDEVVVTSLVEVEEGVAEVVEGTTEEVVLGVVTTELVVVTTELVVVTTELVVEDLTAEVVVEELETIEELVVEELAGVEELELGAGLLPSTISIELDEPELSV